jgi:hypothetical protein
MHTALRAPVEFDIPAQFQQISIPIDQHRFEAPLEQMPHLTVPSIERLRVHAIDVAHQQRQVGLPRVKHEVIVIAHQAIGQHLGVETLRRLGQCGETLVAIHIVPEDGFAPVAARGHVIDGAGEFNAEGARHVGIGYGAARQKARPDPKDAHDPKMLIKALR